MVSLLLGDCLDVLKNLPDNSVDSVVTDPPYGLNFMGKKWDYDVPSIDVWNEVIRVLKPGGYLLSFAGSRTYHRMVCAIEDAGFEIRDQIMWIYGSGFPKSHDISKAIDKAAGAEREVVGRCPKRMPQAQAKGWGNQGTDAFRDARRGTVEMDITAPATDAARQWEGWGTALKPAHEPICVARKPLSEKTVAANVLKWGTGAVNIDGCRIEHVTVKGGNLALNPHLREGINGGNGGKIFPTETCRRVVTPHNRGRWPANIIHDGSEEVVELFPDSKSCNSPSMAKTEGTIFGGSRNQGAIYPGENGSAARFFYCAKTSKKDRDEGLTSPEKKWVQWQTGNGASGKPSSISEGWETSYRNTHPTVKPTELMRYLCRLVTPPKGIILDPFMGSGSTGKAALKEGFDFIGIEREEEYFDIAAKRIKLEQEEKDAVTLPGL